MEPSHSSEGTEPRARTYDSPTQDGASYASSCRAAPRARARERGARTSPFLPPLRHAALHGATCSLDDVDLQSACSYDARSLNWVTRSAVSGCRRAHKRTRAMMYYNQEMEAVGEQRLKTSKREASRKLKLLHTLKSRDISGKCYKEILNAAKKSLHCTDSIAREP